MVMGKDKEKREAYLEMIFLSRSVASTVVKVFSGTDSRCLEWLLDGPESPRQNSRARDAQGSCEGLTCVEG